jgi:CHRD domain
MKSFISKIALSLVIFANVTSCKEKAVVIPTVKYMAMLSGASEVPASGSTATGMLDAVYTPSTKTLAYTFTFSGTTPTAAHIHKAAAGVNGGVAFDFGSTISNGMKGTFTLTAEQETDLMASMFYVNVHSAKTPSGEIRGQLVKN